MNDHTIFLAKVAGKSRDLGLSRLASNLDMLGEQIEASLVHGRAGGYYVCMPMTSFYRQLASDIAHALHDAARWAENAGDDEPEVE